MTYLEDKYENYLDDKYENYLDDVSARGELDSIYALLKKNVNKEIKNELDNLRIENSDLREANQSLKQELQKFKRKEYDIREELEREYKEKERNLYKRPISEIVNLINKTYYSVVAYNYYQNCEYCNNTGIISIIDVFNRTHKVECQCRNNGTKKYKVIEQTIGFINSISIRDNKLAAWVVFTEVGVDIKKEEYGYLSGTYFDGSDIIDSEEKLQKIINRSNKEKYFYDYKFNTYKFTTKELAESFANYLYSINKGTSENDK